MERSPSDTLMAALEDVEEAQDVLIIFIEKNGDIAWRSTTDSLHRKLGMVELVKQAMVASFVRD